VTYALLCRLRQLYHVKGYLAEIRVLPMTLVLGTVILGAYLSFMPVNWGVLSFVLVNAFLFLYVAHLNDTYFDLRKGEYEKGRKLHTVRLKDDAYLPRWGFGPEIPEAPLLKEGDYLKAIIVCSILGVSVMLYLAYLLGPMYACLSIVGLLLALTYSAGLDKKPVLGDTMWEVGVLFALYCGYYSQKLAVDPLIIFFSLPLFIALIGVKALDSWYDVPCDARIGKMTLPAFAYKHNILGLEPLRDLAYIPVYACFIWLWFLLPPKFHGCLLAVLTMLAFSHLCWRGRDMTARKGIIVVCFAILLFIYYAIFALAGLI